jgi:flagellar basal body-associated protein FliL
MRDVVLATLGRRTTEQLADMTLRDSLKAQVVAVASKQLGKKRAVTRIYFPQFVIQ